jgi:excisionase family DNA binding protein
MQTTHHTLTISEASELLGIGESMVRGLVTLGWLDAVKIGGVLLIDVTLIRRAIDEARAHHEVELITTPGHYRPFPSRRASLASRLRPRVLY